MKNQQTEWKIHNKWRSYWEIDENCLQISHVPLPCLMTCPPVIKHGLLENPLFSSAMSSPLNFHRQGDFALPQLITGQ
jgi:hypothetical protein